ncbi:MAG: hypothetical protein ACRDRI_22090 [Pseudonocardiaceae bacterium]
MSTDVHTDPDTHPEDEGLDESYPGCGATTEVQRTTGAGEVRAWSCAACGMNWAITQDRPRSPRSD